MNYFKKEKIEEFKNSLFHNYNNKINHFKKKISFNSGVLDNFELPNFKDKTLKLKDFQIEGLKWLVFCYYNNRNSILCDEMGLGTCFCFIYFS